MIPGVHGVVVTHGADPHAVMDNLRDCAHQLAGLFIVDNAGITDADRWADAGQLACPVSILRNDRNRGTAGAFNNGMRAARDAGAELTLLLDEDSRPGPDMVEQLVAAWKDLRADGAAVAAVGPVPSDWHGTGSTPFIQLDGLHLRRIPCSAGAVIRSEVLVSPGALVDGAALKKVGLLDEGLYIEHVDTEWCMRARTLGFNCYGVCAAHMEHGCGEPQPDPRRAPIRHYYLFRNAMLLMRRAYVPARWKVHELKRLLLLLASVTGAPSPLRQWRCMLGGAMHGLAGRSGPAPAERER